MSESLTDWQEKRIRALETSLDLQRKEFEKLNIEQANRIVELEKVTRKMREVIDKLLKRLEWVHSVVGKHCADDNLSSNETEEIWNAVANYKLDAKEALAEERP